MRHPSVLRRFFSLRWLRSRTARSLAWERHFNAAIAALAHGGDREAGDTAEKALLAALEEAGRFDAGDPRLAATFDNLAHLYLACGRAAEAERVCLQALAAKEAAFGAESAQLATTLNELASTCLLLGRPEEAARHRARAFALLEKKIGPDFADLAGSLARARILHEGRPQDPE